MKNLISARSPTATKLSAPTRIDLHTWILTQAAKIINAVTVKFVLRHAELEEFTRKLTQALKNQHAIFADVNFVNEAT